MSTGGYSKNPFDTSAEALRARIESVADSISQRAQKMQGQEGDNFIGGPCWLAVCLDNVVNAADVGNAVVNATQDAVNHAVNVAQDWVQASGALAVAHGIDVNNMANQTQLVVDAAHAIVEAAHAAVDVAGADLSALKGGATGEGETSAAQASAAQLIQARRKAIEGHRKALRDRILAKRREIKEKIEAARK